MRRISRANAAILIFVLTLSLAAAAPSAVAVPSTPAIQAKKAEAEKARRQLDDLTADLEMKLEDYNTIAEALDRTRRELGRTEQELERANARLAESEKRLAIRAEGIYKGGTVGIIEVLLGTTSFEDLVTRVELLDRISRSDAELVAQVEADRDRVESAKGALETREAEQLALKNQEEAKKRAVEDVVAKQQAYVKSLDGQVVKLIRDEEARQRRIAEAMARAASGSGKGSPAGRRGGGPLGQPHEEAVVVARRYLGVPYVWGGTTPSGFDCSGLTQYCYRAIGIELPRTSGEQYGVGGFIPKNRLDLLAPGDLVFFGYHGDPKRVHHVGMYVGNGQMIHAPGSGGHVCYASLIDRIRNRRDYVGAVRP